MVSIVSKPRFELPLPSAREEAINVAMLGKGDQRYMIIYRDGGTEEALRAVARYAANPELDFTWYDAAVISRRIRDEGVGNESQ